MTICHSRKKSRAIGLAGALILGTLCSAIARADELSVSDGRGSGRRLEATYRFEKPFTGSTILDVEWTDVAGRVVERRRIPLEFSNASRANFALDPRRAVSVKNSLSVHLSPPAGSDGGSPLTKERGAATWFYVSPPDDPWSDYQVIVWQDQTRAAQQALKQIGVSAARVGSDRRGEPGPGVIDRVEETLDANLGWYLENTATDFYSAYHRWFPDRPVNWRFDEVKQRYWANPADPSVFVRDPSLSDPAWLDKIAQRLKSDVRALQRYRPLFYNLADEPGIADLAAFWDFDLSPPSLAGMRDWLKTRYGGLDRLNREWGTAFHEWSQVVPMTTDEAIRRSDQNFASWGDFKEWMDVAFARAVKHGTDALHSADSSALAAIEGGQIPGWGGYDYARLADSVDVIELGDYIDNVEMVSSFNRNVVMLTTSFGSGPAEEHRVWRELLRGTRGLILWDSERELVDKAGKLGDRGRAATPYFREIRNGIGALLIGSRRHEDPIAIAYSPMSMKIDWLLDRIQRGEDWSKRSAETEYEDMAIRTSMANFVHAIEHLGLRPVFIAADRLADDEIAPGKYRVLILPRTVALSERTAAAVVRFVRQGGIVIADGVPGTFDEHGRLRGTPVLQRIFPAASSDSRLPVRYGRGAAVLLAPPAPDDAEGRQHLRTIFAGAGVASPFRLTREGDVPVDDVETYMFNKGNITIIALLRDLKGGGDPNVAESLVLNLPKPYEIYDIRRPGSATAAVRMPIKLDAVSPVILALSRRPLTAPAIAGPAVTNAGADADFRIGWGQSASAGRGLVRVDVTDPDGTPVEHYGRPLRTTGAEATYRLPLAINDKPGTWTIRARDPVSGKTATERLTVTP